MIESFFLTVNEWITGGTAIAAIGCFIWGVISIIFSPCHLASIPLIIAYVGGQQRALSPKQAGSYAVVFTSGLFITIAVIGIVCALLGQTLGDVGNYWQILIGLLLVWVALGMLGLEKFTLSGSLPYGLNLSGPLGAFVLGLTYGLLSGSCTFGFIAPVLAMITVQKKLAAGILFILLFGAGHCLPIVIAGSSTAAVRRLLENTAWRSSADFFRKTAGVIVGVLGLYFMISPFWGS